MDKQMIILGELRDEDIEWLSSNGVEQQVIANTHIIHEGQKNDHIYIIQNGMVGAFISSANHQIRVFGSGEMIGAKVLIDHDVPLFDFIAIENTLLLAVPVTLLQKKLNEDQGFASRLYHAIGAFLCEKLRNATINLSNQITQSQENNNSQSPIIPQTSAALEQFKELLLKAEKIMLKKQPLSLDFRQEIFQCFDQFVESMNQELGTDSSLSMYTKEQIGAHLQKEVLPFMLLSVIGERYYSKPRGYAGDFLTIEMIYKNQAQGTGRLGPIIDQCFLDLKAAKAVRNRKKILVDAIFQAIHTSPNEPVNITSFACGPAREAFDAFQQLDDPNRVKFNLVDIDLQALAYVDEQCERYQFRKNIRKINANLVYLIRGTDQLNIPQQHLIYSIGLIDYFSDRFVIKLLDYIYDLLLPGGRVILGNFHSKNSNKAVMDYILDWKLIHRDENDMNRLFKQSAFGCQADQIVFEEEGINLFAVCSR